jgi:GNAT superfamily N-acetyltransferase
MAATIGLVTSAAAREAVYRFRYQVYVREMGRTEPLACHQRGRLTDPMDETAFIVAATDTVTRKTVGTIRSNLLREGGACHYEELYGLATLSAAERHATSITTRLMVTAEHRGGALAVQLAMAAYALAGSTGIESDYIDCNDPLVPFFTRLGYRRVRRVTHPQYGNVTVMRLEVDDTSHLSAVRSPLLRVRRTAHEAPPRPMPLRDAPSEG